MGKLLLVVFAVLGVVGGGAVGYFLKPAPEMLETADAMVAEDQEGESSLQLVSRDIEATDSEYFPLSSKLIVPFTRTDGVEAFVAIDLHIELEPGGVAHAEMHEPKLVDALLRVIVTFAATGAFDDHTRSVEVLDQLNRQLTLSAQAVLGSQVRGMLITNLITREV